MIRGNTRRLAGTLLLGVAFAAAPVAMESAFLTGASDAAYAQGKGNGGDGGNNGNGNNGGQGRGGDAATSGSTGGGGGGSASGGASEGGGSEGGSGGSGGGGGSGGDAGDRGHVRDDPDLVGIAQDDEWDTTFGGTDSPGASEFGHSRGRGQRPDSPAEAAAPAEMLRSLSTLDAGNLQSALSRLSADQLAAIATACSGSNTPESSLRVCAAAGGSSGGGSTASSSE